MPITKDASNVITYTAKKTLNTPTGEDTGVTRENDFSVCGAQDFTRQLKVDLSEAETGAVVTLKAAAGTTGAIVLELPATSGEMGGGMTGPETSTDNGIPRFDGTGGDTLQASGISISDTGVITPISGSDINVAGNLLPSTDATRNLGNGNFRWVNILCSGTIYAQNLRTAFPGDTACISLENRAAFDSGQAEILTWASGLKFSQLTANSVVTLNGSKIATSVVGASGSFTTADGKTVTVTGGIITEIAGP